MSFWYFILICEGDLQFLFPNHLDTLYHVNHSFASRVSNRGKLREMGNPTVPLTSVFTTHRTAYLSECGSLLSHFPQPLCIWLYIGVFFFVDCAGNQVFVKAGLKLQRLRQLPLIGCDVGSVFIRQRLVDAALVDAVQNGLQAGPHCLCTPLQAVFDTLHQIALLEHHRIGNSHAFSRWGSNNSGIPCP